MITTDDIAFKMLDTVIGGGEDVLAVGRALIQVAASRGLVVTIETVPEKPLAMGNYGLLVSVREDRAAAALKAKTLEDNDAKVGRRRKWSSAGGAR